MASNWGDISTWDDDGKTKKICRLCAAADEWVEKKWAITSSRATSEAEHLVEEEEDVIIVSD
ncbi:hypothetical protein B0H10DRAFT_2227294 [Mycena sp. CBHHK59/15]|nr:hypothetical protein B0H10DRAFT_2227294 [Mycena sp. CBHHK59/15]